MSGEVSVNGLIIPSAPNTMSAGVWTQETTKLFLEGVWSSSVYIEGAIYIMCLWKLSEHDALVNHHFALKKIEFLLQGCTMVYPFAARRPFLPTHMRTSRPEICSRPLQQHPAGRISWENTSWSPSELPSQVGFCGDSVSAHFFRIPREFQVPT